MKVTLERIDGIGLLTLNSPPANAYDLEMLDDLQATIREVRTDAAIRAVVVRSGSEKFFSAGADIATLKDADAAGFDHFVGVAGETMAMLEATPKLFVAAIAGHAMGGGLELALACDLRFAAQGRYRLGLVEAGLGLNPAMGGTQRLPRIIGRSLALHMIATGEAVDPEVARERGIVDWLEPAEGFEQAVMDYAARLASGPTLAQGMAKLSINRGMETGFGEAIAIERAHQNILFATHDAREGLAAFLEKRTPEFKGK